MGSLDQIAKSRKRDKHVAELSSGGSLDRIAHERKSGDGSSIEQLPSTAKKKHHGGFLHELGHALKQTGVDFKDAALHTPGGLVAMVGAVESDILTGLKHGQLDPISSVVLHGKNTHKIAKGQLEQVKDDVRHPLRHPGNTLLDALAVASLGAGTAARVGEVGRVAAAGEGAGAIAKAALEGPKVPTRVLKIGDLEVRGHYSRSAGSRAVQRVADKALAKGAEKGVGVTVGRRELSAERLQQGRAAKWLGREERVADSLARAPGTRLQVLGQKLKSDELRAIRLVAEEAPVERRLAAKQLRKAGAKHPKEQARHQERIDLTKAAMEHLTTDAEGRPIFKPEATKLRKVYDQLAAVSHDRETMLKNVGLMDDASLQAAKTKTLRTVVGLPRDEAAPTLRAHGNEADTPPHRGFEAAGAEDPGVSGLPQDEVVHWPTSDELVALSHEAVTPHQGFRDQPLIDAAIGAARNRHGYEGGDVFDAAANLAHAVERQQALVDGNKRLGTAAAGHMLELHGHDVAALDEGGRLGKMVRAVSTGTAKPEALAQFMRQQLAPRASANAIHIGNPVERTKLAGKPKVSSTGTFGHTRKPGSLKVASGGSIEHALERNDVTQIAAERHSEAVRLAKIDRVRTRLAKAGHAVPRRRDDVFVWTDNLTKNERIPAEVRKYLDNPESVAQLPEADRVSLTEKLRQSVFERHDWHADPETRAQFEKVAAEGKGVFVPRKVVGEYAKREITLPGSHFVDAVNNAQKAGLIYLKLNYPVVQGLSNVAMNIIHEGFAAPVRLTQAVKLDKAVGPELASVVDDIMGQGAVVQAQFEGQGVIARGSQKLAHAMSSKVDTPARRAAFLHEAHKAGYGTGPKFEQLLTDDTLAGDLAEVAQRAKEAIVDYGDLGPNERAIVRRLVFVYPWQKGATKYAAHFLRDHPVQAAALGHVGQQGKQISDEHLGEVPSYLEGVFDAGGGLVNPSGLNFFQTPAQIGEGLAGLASGNPASPSGQDFLAPLPSMLVAALTRKDSIGRSLPHNPAAALRHLTIEQPAAAALLRAALAPHSDLARKALGSQTSSKTFPNPDDAYWRFLLGGLYPRDYSKPALNRNAKLEQSGR